MDEILVEFQSESKQLGGQLLEILESIEGDFTQLKRLEQFGQVVDRIMGSAMNLAMLESPLQSSLAVIGRYCELCKLVGYKMSQVANENLFTVVVALLLDATEMLQEMIDGLSKGGTDPKALLPKTFLDRLRWVSGQFPAHLRGSLNVDKSPDDIEAVLKAMGL